MSVDPFPRISDRRCIIPKHPLTPDWSVETARMRVAAELRICFEAVWRRRGGRTGIDGPFAKLMQRDIEARFASGPIPDDALKDGSTVMSEYPLRWAQFCAMLDTTGHPLHQAERQLSLLYRGGITTGGDIESPAWRWLEESAGLEAVLRRKQSLEIGLGSVAVRPRMVPFRAGQYYPPSIATITPDRAIAIENPAHAGHAGVFLEMLPDGDGVHVWDVSDPSLPRWGRWDRAQDWAEGCRPRWVLEGEYYPWWYGDEPIMPVVCSQFTNTPTQLLGVSESELQTVKDLILQRTYCALHAHASSFNASIILSDEEIKGLRGAMNDPKMLLNLWGMGSKSLVTVPHSLDASSILWSLLRDRTLEWAQRYDTGFEVRESGSAKSGAAIMLELTGKYLLRQQLERKARGIDTHIIRGLVATYNYLVLSGALNVVESGPSVRWVPSQAGDRSMTIPEGEITLKYPMVWNQAEREQIRKEMLEANESPRAIWLLSQGMDDDRPNGPNWQAADEAIRANQVDRMAYASLGYGLTWQQLNQRALETVEDEAVTYDVPPDVASTASRGLMLRDAFPGRSLAGLSSQNTKMLRRARALREQIAQGLGQVRELNTWLEAHIGDSSLEADVGEWGNKDDPSGPWITWLTQGGEEARAWTASILTPAVEADEAAVQEVAA